MQTRDRIWFILLWIIVIVLVNPIGEFPLNDDWGYAKVVQRLVETGAYDPGTWPVMTLFTQVLWGSLFAGVFGFSFTALRISTLLLAILGSYWIFKSVRYQSHDRSWSWVTLLTLIFNPLYFNLSFTFMTDVPFTVLVIGAILLYRKAMNAESNGYWALACLATIAATLIRQPALLLAPAFGLAAIAHRPGRRSVIWAIGGIIISYGALLWYIQLIGTPGETPGDPNSLAPMLRRLRFPLFWDLFSKRGGMILFYAAVFLFPVILLRIPQLLQHLAHKRKVILAVLAAATTLLFAFFSWSEIPAGNIINFFGLGPTPLVGRDARYFEASLLPNILWPGLRAGGYLMVMLLLFVVYDRFFRLSSWKKWPASTYWKFGLVLFISAYGLYLLLDRYHFDRYQLALLPTMLLLLAPSRKPDRQKWIRIGSLSYLAIMGLFTIGATRDNLTWNHTRWAVLQGLMDQGISPYQIDGGLEFNGWYDTAPQGPFSFEHKSWWFVDEDQYVLSFSRDLPCSVGQTPYPVSSWWPGSDTLYVHKRPAIARRDTIFSDLETVAADSNLLATNYPGLTLTDAQNRLNDRSHSGQHAFFLTPAKPYAGKISLQPVHPCEAFTITTWRLGNDRSAGIVASAPDANAFHTFQNVFTEDTQADGWHRIRHEIRLPENYPSDQLDIYLWNPVNDSIWMDDVEIVWRRVE